MRKLILIAFCFLLSFLLVSCNKDTGENNDVIDDNNDIVDKDNTNSTNPKVIITLTNGKTIKIELYPDVAPISVENFLSLVDSKFYDGVVFHRVIYNFMIQAGGYYISNNIVYSKPSTKTIKGEFSNNGVKNDIKHVPGVLSMARATPYDSASSQFFICTATSPHLDGDYAAFGKTIDQESLDNAIEISEIQTANIGGGLTDFPYNGIGISTIRRLEDNISE